MTKTIKVQMTDTYSMPAHCRRLLKAGESPDTRLEAYRGEMLCLITNNIGKAAKLEVRENGQGTPKFVSYIRKNKVPKDLP